MTTTYLDSSALVRLCAGEGDLRAIEQAMTVVPVTSVLAEVEVRAAVNARLHRGTITSDQHAQLVDLAGHVLGAVAQISLTTGIREAAIQATSRFLLRASDAVHVGTAVVALRHQRRRGNGLRFLTADVRQGQAAREMLGSENVLLV